ncbi:MAG: YciI family protein [Panacagrimonas sp.]
MLYMILGRDQQNSGDARMNARPAHVARLKALQEQGRLIVAGPLPRIDAPSLEGGVSGSLIVAEFEDLASARSWADADPYIEAGVYAEVEIKPFIKALPA